MAYGIRVEYSGLKERRVMWLACQAFKNHLPINCKFHAPHFAYH